MRENNNSANDVWENNGFSSTSTQYEYATTPVGTADYEVAQKNKVSGRKNTLVVVSIFLGIVTLFSVVFLCVVVLKNKTQVNQTDVVNYEDVIIEETEIPTTSRDDLVVAARKRTNNKPEYISAGDFHTVGINEDGLVVSTFCDGSNCVGQCGVTHWRGVKAVSTGWNYTVGLKYDGTVLTTNTEHMDEISKWVDIVSVSAGDYHTVGLRQNGTVVAVGYNYDGRCNVAGWSDIKSVSAGWAHTVALRSDGTVVATGNNEYGQCNVSGWSNIKAVYAGGCYTIGLKNDGTVVAAGSNMFGQCDVDGWYDIVAVYTGGYCTVGLKSDGTVVVTDYIGNSKYNYGQFNVESWSDIVSVACGLTHTVGLKSDGTVVAVGYNGNGQCEVAGWKDIKIAE